MASAELMRFKGYGIVKGKFYFVDREGGGLISYQDVQKDPQKYSARLDAKVFKEMMESGGDMEALRRKLESDISQDEKDREEQVLE